MSRKKTDHSWATYKRLVKHVLPYWPVFLISLLGYAIYGATQAGLAAMMQYIPAAFGESTDIGGFLDRFYPIESPENLRIVLPISIVIIAICRGMGSYLGGFYIALVGRNLVHDVRQQLFAHMQILPTSYFQQRGSSKMISMITYNVEQLSLAATDAIKVLVREGLTVVALLIFLCLKNWQLTLIFLLLAPVTIMIVSFTSNLLSRYSRNIQNSMGSVTQVAAETIRAITEVKTYGAQAYEQNRFKGASATNLRQSLKLIRVTEIASPIIQVITYFSLSLLFWVGLNPELRGDMGTGDFLAYITAAAMIARPLKQLTNINTSIQKGIAAAKSIFEVIDQPEEQDKGSLTFDRCRGHIEFRNMSFSYPNSNQPTLKNINLTIQPGQTLALVGRSGAGKTTLASLVARHSNTPAKQIFIDGEAIEQYQLKNLREQIAIVSQQIMLFDDSIKANIAYGELQQADQNAIKTAAKSAHALEFIDALEHGFDTQVGENGTALSGGQRQRIALARAFLKDAPILILDEATSALDNESERHIQRALESIMQDRTTIVIAHRLSTVENADIIVVMDDGEIVESGSHSELMTKGGAYTELYKSHFSD